MIWRVALILILLAGPAQAGPIAGLIGLLTGAAGFAGAITFSSLWAGIAWRLVATVALSALSRLTAKKPRDPGLQTKVTLSSGTNPLSFVLGRYATSGVAVCPPMSHGASNRYLTYVIALSALPVQGLSRIVVDGEYVTLGTVPNGNGFLPFTGRLAGRGGVKFKDGTQSVADPWLLATYGSYPERPWTAAMIGRGVAHAIVDFDYNREVFQGLPQVRFEIDGARLYDPRHDTTVGGSGVQRWAEPATWGFTLNPAVMAYNILRGITLDDGSVWGGGVAAADLPLANWFAAMNVCDAPVALSGGGTEPQFRAGFEVRVDDEPVTVIEELMSACFGAVVEVGGVWKIRVGPPALPVLFFTDDDVLVTRAQDYDPFPSPEATFNAVQASYPEPESLWESKDAPPRFDAALEAEDGGRRLVADLRLPAAPYATQVQRIMLASLRDHRRMRRHTLSLPPEAMVLEPLDTIAWTSARNGYAGKLFEAGQVALEAMSLVVTVSLREVDPADYDWVPGYALPVSAPPSVVVVPVAAAVPGFALAALALSDGTVDRRPALRLSWTAADMAGVRGLTWELRRAGAAVELRGDVQDVAAGQITLVDGLLPATAYEARMRALANAPTLWTAWAAATTPDVRLGAADLVASIAARLATLQAWIDGGVTDLPGNLLALSGELAAEALARAAETGQAAARWRDQSAALQALAAQALETAAQDHAAREALRQGVSARVEMLQADYDLQIVALAGADLAQVSRLETLEAGSAGLTAGIATVDLARVAGDDALALQIATLSVGSAVQFDHARIWYFNTMIEGWTGSPAVPLVTSPGWLRPAAASYVESPTALAVDAGAYGQVRLRLRQVGAPVWLGQLWWEAAGQGWDAARRVTATEPVWNAGIGLLTVDVPWTGTVDRIRLDLASAADAVNYIEIDWVAVGRPAPGASSAELVAERVARINGDSALATDIATVNAALVHPVSGNAALAGGLSVLSGRVTATEGSIITEAGRITAVEASIASPTTGNTALAGAIDALETLVAAGEGGEVVQASALRTLRAAIQTLAAEGVEAAARDHLGLLAGRSYTAEAAELLNTRIDLTNAGALIVAQAVTVLQAAIPGLASAAALTALTTTVSSQGGSLSAVADALTDLGVTVSGSSATTRLRMTVEATPGGAEARIGLKASATGAEGDTRSAALFLDALPGNASRVVVQADQFVLMSPSGLAAPFIVDGGVTYVDVARIRDADIGTLKIAGQAVTTDKIAADAVTLGGVAGSAPSVTNNAATWTTVCSFDLTTPVGCYVQGTIFARWTVAPLSLPVGFEMAVLVGGVTMVALNQTTLALDNNLFFFAPFTRQGVPAGTTPVVFQIRNAGGQGVFQSNLQAIAGMK